MGKRQDVSYPKLCAICEIQMELERPAVHVMSGCALVEKDLYQVKDSAWLRHTDPANPEQPLNRKPYCHQAVVPGFHRTHIILYRGWCVMLHLSSNFSCKTNTICCYWMPFIMKINCVVYQHYFHQAEYYRRLRERILTIYLEFCVFRICYLLQ